MLCMKATSSGHFGHLDAFGHHGANATAPPARQRTKLGPTADSVASEYQRTVVTIAMAIPPCQNGCP